MRILVTGGAGFVGSHLVDLLVRRRQRVTVLDDLSSGSLANLAHHERHIRFVRADVREKVSGRFDRIYHLASPASPVEFGRDPIRTLVTNATGTWRVLELARRTSARVLLASTSEVYGDPLVHPQPETYVGNVDPIGPRSAYDEGKRFAEALTIAYVRSARVDARIARIFNAYGPRMRPWDGRLPSALIASALRGEPLLVHGSGRQTRSLCYVLDTARGLVAAMEKGASGAVYNIGRPEELRVIDFARLVRVLTGTRAPIRFAPARPGDIRRRRPEIRRARRELRWEPTTRLREGLIETIKWFAEELGRQRAD